MKKLIYAALFAPFLASASLITVQPVEYTFDQMTDVGSYNYEDSTGKQLIDGLFGNGAWYNDLGNGNAYEWVGWTDTVVNIDFKLDYVRTLDTIMVSTQQSGGGLFLPSWSVFSWQNNAWVMQAEQQTVRTNDMDIYKHYLTLSNLNFSSDKIRVQLRQPNSNQWMFVDEIMFYQTPDMLNLDIEKLNSTVKDVSAPAASFSMVLFLSLISLRKKLRAGRSAK